MQQIFSLESRDLRESALWSEIFIVLSDIDYTLVDFESGHRKGIEAIADSLGSGIAKRTSDLYNLVLEGQRKPNPEQWDLRSHFEEVLRRISKFQTEWIDKFELKVWSRELFIILAAEELGLDLTKEQIEQARDVYWSTVSNSTKYFSDTQSFLDFINVKSVPLVLMTGSDSILRIIDSKTVSYDPGFSEMYKMRRIIRLNIPAADVVVGDPFDKPDQRFFDKAFERMVKITKFQARNVLVLGDSIKSDLEVPEKLGCKTILLQR